MVPLVALDALVVMSVAAIIANITAVRDFGGVFIRHIFVAALTQLVIFVSAVTANAPLIAIAVVNGPQIIIIVIFFAIVTATTIILLLPSAIPAIEPFGNLIATLDA